VSFSCYLYIPFSHELNDLHHGRYRCNRTSVSAEAEGTTILAWGPNSLNLTGETLYILSAGPTDTLVGGIVPVTTTDSAGKSTTQTVTNIFDLSPTGLEEIAVDGPNAGKG
jgi:hypothetical protein